MEIFQVRDLRHQRYLDLIKHGQVVVKAFCRKHSLNNPDTVSQLRLVIRGSRRRHSAHLFGSDGISLVGISEQQKQRISLGAGTKIAAIFRR